MSAHLGWPVNCAQLGWPASCAQEPSLAGGSQKACLTATQGATISGARRFNPRRPPKCPPIEDMIGPTWARSNHLGHGLAKIAEALGICGKDNRYNEYSRADRPQARWGGNSFKLTTGCKPPLYTFSAERRPSAVNSDCRYTTRSIGR